MAAVVDDSTVMYNTYTGNGFKQDQFNSGKQPGVKQIDPAGAGTVRQSTWKSCPANQFSPTEAVHRSTSQLVNQQQSTVNSSDRKTTAIIQHPPAVKQLPRKPVLQGNSKFQETAKTANSQPLKTAWRQSKNAGISKDSLVAARRRNDGSTAQTGIRSTAGGQHATPDGEKTERSIPENFKKNGLSGYRIKTGRPIPLLYLFSLNNDTWLKNPPGSCSLWQLKSLLNLQIHHA